MKTQLFKSLPLILALFVGVVQASFADVSPSVTKIYMSNNQGEISLEQAYNRLEDSQQNSLIQGLPKFCKPDILNKVYLKM